MLRETTKWLSTTTFTLGVLTQGLQGWMWVKDRTERGMINTQLGPVVEEQSKFFSGTPDYTPVSVFEEGGGIEGKVTGYVIGGRYVPML